MVSSELFIDIILPAAISCKWVPGIFPGGVNTAGVWG